MRRPNPPRPRPPSIAQLAKAAALLALHGTQTLAMSDGRRFVLIDPSGLFRSLVDDIEVVRLAAQLEPAH